MSATAAVAAVPPPPETVDGDVTEVPAEGEVTETPAPVEGETTETPAEGEAPAEGEPAAAPVEIPEDVLKAATEKYAAGQMKLANQAMAAARRAEARTEATKAENGQLKAHLGEYQSFVGDLRAGKVSALQRIGIGGVRELLDLFANAGTEKVPTVEERLTAWEQEKKDRETADASRAAEAAIENSQRLVFEAIGSDKKRWGRAATPTGNDRVWDAIVAYNDKYGSVPDAVVPLLADEVEKQLRAEFGDPTDSATRPAAKNGASPTGQAAPGGRNSGKTLTHKASAGAPGERALSMDPDERRAQVSALMRANGEL